MKSIKKSWKTTICGIAAILTGVKIIITTGDLSSALASVSVGIGLIFAKDSDVSGV